MPNESTAINDLIQRFGNKPLRDSTEVVFSAPALPPPPMPPTRRGGFAPESARLPAAPPAFEARPMPMPGPVSRPMPIATTLPRPGMRPPRAPKPQVRPVNHSHELTVRVPRKIARSYAIAGLFALGSFMVGIAGYRALWGSGSASAPIAAPEIPPAAAVAAPAAAPIAPIVAPLPTPPPAPPPPTLVELRLDSQPTGAAVMIVDRGKSSPLGSTPLSASVDPDRQYDLVFTLPGLPPKVEHIDPRTTRQVAVALVDPTPPPPAPPPAPAPAKAPTSRHHAKSHAHRAPQARR